MKRINKARKWFLRNLEWLILLLTSLVCAGFLIAGHPAGDGSITLDGNNAKISEATEEFIAEAKAATIEYAKEAVPAVIINDAGEEETIEVPTVESIDGGEILNEENCPEGQECGMGAFVYAPTDTYQHFKDYTIGKCWNVDGFAGAQCWDLASLHSMNYTANKRVFSTCGTGAARGIWTCKEQNAGSEYGLVSDINKTNVGDIGVWGTGVYGHTCIIAGPVKNGYVACLGQNQGGSACPGGGAATNVINLSINGFLGAFHPKTYTPTPPPTPTPAPDPTPSPAPTPHNPGDKINYTYVKGDYFSKVLVSLGLDEGHLWGESGTVEYYTRQLIEQNMLDINGNVKLHIPFTLKRR